MLETEEKNSCHLYVNSSTSFSHRESFELLNLSHTSFKSLSTLSTNQKALFTFAIKNYNEVVRLFREGNSELKVFGIPPNIIQALLQLQNKPKSTMSNEQLLTTYIPPNILGKLFDYQKEGVMFGLLHGGRVRNLFIVCIAHNIKHLLIGAYSRRTRCWKVVSRFGTFGCLSRRMARFDSLPFFIERTVVSSL